MSPDTDKDDTFRKEWESGYERRQGLRTKALAAFKHESRDNEDRARENAIASLITNHPVEFRGLMTTMRENQKFRST